jgi:hypothetical protein
MTTPQKKSQLVLHIEGEHNLAFLNDLLQEIPNRYAPQLERIFAFLEQHTKPITLPNETKDEHHD